ncbi:hypothetical protein DICVIV_04801 [Dictyocaulus viviparus]|uniref:F-box domain protein n=1 Tax=Dictyocaulus viviparus TaxID=29172 RepID=A0A0D8XZ96_DICVI|nr:hypothetical protein DICVIV_04801 [Dictyocaulus viviparus]
MMVENKLLSEINSEAEPSWQSRSRSVVTSPVTLFVNSLLFELKKVTFKWKFGFLLLTKKSYGGLGNRNKMLRKNNSNKDSSTLVDLFTHLSSVFLCDEIDFPCETVLDCLRLHCYEKRMKLLDLDDMFLLNIANAMDGKTVMVFAQVCSKLRGLIMCNISSLKRTMSATFDIFISFNKQTKQEDVRALKCGRSIVEPSYYGYSLYDVVPPIPLCQLRITFGSNIEILKWTTEIRHLFKDCRIVPVALIFGGASSGVDLRCFNEDSFIAFVRLFVPHVKEVQLATSRLFEFSNSPRLVFSMINVLRLFGITYEQSFLRYTTEDIGRVIDLWRFSPRAHSCDVFINRSYGYDEINWLRYEAATTIDGNRVTNAIVQHALFENVKLHFHFH